MTPKTIRCAVYTRKSSEEGLEQEFNSLDAQRAACEAYILSQAGEGWTVVPRVYDDGGYSGGNMDRPAIAALLGEVAAGAIDVIVVYKIDRLTRSLTDFARIVDVLDKAGASFVSVTQAFNTTTSMGRLTLNVLLSFAQFEREVTGERIRDKIAASKARGIWMGGMLSLGYDLVERRLVVNPAESETVRRIFRRYLELGSVHRLRDELRASGVRSKQWRSSRDRQMGGAVIGRGGLYHILRNRLYLGEIVHRELVYAGRHQAIIEVELFEQVQAKLAANAIEGRQRPQTAVRSVLLGRVFDTRGGRFSPSFAYGRGGRRYRYYVASALQVGQKDGSADSQIRRVPAEAFERWVLVAVRRITAQTDVSLAALTEFLMRIELGETEIQLLISTTAFSGRHRGLLLAEAQGRLRAGERAVWEAGDQTAIRVSIPSRMQFRGGRTWLIGADQADGPVPNRGLVAGLRRAHRELRSSGASPLADAAMLRSAASPTTPYARQLCQLAFLAPDLQLMILEGRQPPRLTIRKLLDTNPPLDWGEQRTWIRQLGSAALG